MNWSEIFAQNLRFALALNYSAMLQKAKAGCMCWSECECGLEWYPGRGKSAIPYDKLKEAWYY